jgi:nucleoside phosphorylase
MAMELRPLVRRLHGRVTTVDGVRAFIGYRGQVEVVAGQIGVGPTVAAASTERLLERFPPDHVLVCGIAGGIDPAATVGSVVVPSTVLDVANGREYPTAPLGDVERNGTVGTVDELFTDPARLDRLVERGVVALEMESAGVGSVCRELGVPFTVFRVISDRPDQGTTDPSTLQALRPDGSADGWAAVRLMAARPGRIPTLVRLGVDASRAAATAARVTLAALD